MFYKNADAQKRAEQYRDKVLALVRAKGYEIGNRNDTWGGATNPNRFDVAGDPPVWFDLRANSARGNFWAERGTPDLEFVPYGLHGARTVHWKEPDRSWDDRSASRHAQALEKYIEACRRHKVAEAGRVEEEKQLDQSAERINKALGIDRYSGVCHADHYMNKLCVEVRSRHLVVKESQVEPLLRDLYAVLKTYGLEK